MGDDADFANHPYSSISPTAGCPDSCEVLYSATAGVVAILSLCYGLLSVAAVGGNALVIWAVLGSRRMRRSTTNFFIANLALADITIGLFCIPFQFQAALLQRWDLPWFMCGFCPFVQVLSVNVSIFTLTAIAVDRHRAIVRPLAGARPSGSRARILLGAIWALAATLALPMALALGVTEVPVLLPVMATRESFDNRLADGEAPASETPDHLFSAFSDRPEIVTKAFCSNVGLSTSAMMTYRHALAAVQYVCPLAVISVAYVRVGMRLWGSKAPGTAHRRRDANLLRHKKKVIKMLFIVVALFAICWLPLQTYNVMQSIVPKINEYKYINIIWFCCDWLAMSNSCCNPIIYGIYSNKFKREFARRFRLSSTDSMRSPGSSLRRDDSSSAQPPSHVLLPKGRKRRTWQRLTRHARNPPRESTSHLQVSSTDTA